MGAQWPKLSVGASTLSGHGHKSPLPLPFVLLGQVYTVSQRTTRLDLNLLVTSPKSV